MERQGKLGTLRKRGMIARKIIKDGVTQQNKKVNEEPYWARKYSPVKTRSMTKPNM